MFLSGFLLEDLGQVGIMAVEVPVEALIIT